MNTLDRLKPGQNASVKRVHGRGATFQRLLEMGLIEGTQLTMVRFAPLGDPLEVRLHDYHLSLRAAEAAMVEVSL